VIGYALLLSDVRVMFCPIEERDCLQNICPIARFLALGFAGYVQIGLAVAHIAREWLHTKTETMAAN